MSSTMIGSDGLAGLGLLVSSAVTKLGLPKSPAVRARKRLSIQAPSKWLALNQVPASVAIANTPTWKLPNDAPPLLPTAILLPSGDTRTNATPNDGMSALASGPRLVNARDPDAVSRNTLDPTTVTIRPSGSASNATVEPGSVKLPAGW
jgi:hypothetical protein